MGLPEQAASVTSSIFFSLEEGAAVNLFLCLCSINRIREKAWKQWDKVPVHMVMYTEMED